MTVTIRPAQPAEYPAIGALTIEAYRADGQLASERGYARTLRDVAGRAQTGQVLVAVDGDKLLGSVTLVLSGSEYAQLARAGEAEFRMLAVDPAAQGRGVGEALVNACLDRAAARGCTAVVICTRDLAKAAQRLYARMGFERVPEKDWSPGPGVDLLALRYQLASRLW